MDDIDLFSGGMSEPAFDGGLVGETFSKLMGLQLQRVKFGDRFFFDNERHWFGFTDRESQCLAWNESSEIALLIIWLLLGLLLFSVCLLLFVW